MLQDFAPEFNIVSLEPLQYVNRICKFCLFSQLFLPLFPLQTVCKILFWGRIIRNLTFLICGDLWNISDPTGGLPMAFQTPREFKNNYRRYKTREQFCPVSVPNPLNPRRTGHQENVLNLSWRSSRAQRLSSYLFILYRVLEKVRQPPYQKFIMDLGAD